MIISKRRNIIQYISTLLKNINGEPSSFDPEYTYKCNIIGKPIIPKRLFLDEISVFPTLCVVADYEQFDYGSFGAVMSYLEMSIMINMNKTDSYNYVDDLYEDIEHVLINNPQSIDHKIVKIEIMNYERDNGIMDPFSLGIIELVVQYEA